MKEDNLTKINEIKESNEDMKNEIYQSNKELEKKNGKTKHKKFEC